MGEAAEGVGRASAGRGTRGPGACDATGAGRCPASPELLAVPGLETWRLMELWGSKILSSMTQACGGGCNREEGATRLSGLCVKHVGSFTQVSQCQKSTGLGRLWFLGSILKKHRSSWLSLPRGGRVSRRGASLSGPKHAMPLAPRSPGWIWIHQHLLIQDDCQPFRPVPNH